MKHYTYPTLFALSLTLAACGGGSSGGDASVATAAQDASASAALNAAVGTAAPAAASPAPSPSPAPAPSPSPSPAPAPGKVTQIIEYYGDSTVWGYRSQIGGQVAQPAPAVFAQTLAAAGRNYDVRNEGVSGTTACDLVNGTDGKHPAWSAQMSASRAAYVLVNFAINDEWKYDLNTYQGCLRTLAQTARQNGKQMIFETPNPTRDSGSGGLDVWVNAMKAVAAEQQVPVIDQYSYLTAYLNGQSVYSICPDGLHPRDEIYMLKGEYAARMFVRLSSAKAGMPANGSNRGKRGRKERWKETQGAGSAGARPGSTSRTAAWSR